MSHRPVYPYTTVIICVYLRAKYASPSADIEVQKKNTQESAPPPVRLLDQRCRHLGNLTSPETKIARLPYCRDVTVGVSSSSGLAPLLRRAAKRWQRCQ